MKPIPLRGIRILYPKLDYEGRSENGTLNRPIQGKIQGVDYGIQTVRSERCTLLNPSSGTESTTIGARNEGLLV